MRKAGQMTIGKTDLRLSLMSISYGKNGCIQSKASQKKDRFSYGPYRMGLETVSDSSIKLLGLQARFIYMTGRNVSKAQRGSKTNYNPKTDFKRCSRFLNRSNFKEFDNKKYASASLHFINSNFMLKFGS